MEMLFTELLPANSRVRANTSRRKYIQPTPWAKGECLDTILGAEDKGNDNTALQELRECFLHQQGQKLRSKILHLHRVSLLQLYQEGFLNF